MINYSFEFYGLAFFTIILLRYFISAGATHLLLYGAFGHYFIDSHSDSCPKNRPPPWRSIKGDIKLSVLSSMIFALGAALIMSAYDSGNTESYADIHFYPLWYLGISYFVAIVI